MPFVFYWNSFGEPKVIYISSILFFCLLISFGVREFQKADATIKKYFIPGLFFKLICGIGVGVLYSYYYESGDTFVFFEDGKKIADLAFTDTRKFFQFLWNGDENFTIWSQLKLTQPRALFFSKLTAIGYLISFGNYWMVSMLFSLVSFLSVWKLVEKIVEFFPATKQAAVIAFLFFPSVVFWSSGLMKESIAMAGLFAVAYVFLKYWVQNKINIFDVVVLIIGFWLLWNLKYYYAGILLISVGAMLIARLVLKKRSMSTLQTVILFLGILILPSLLVTQLHPNFYASRILEVVIKNYEAYRVISKPENLIGYYHLEPTLTSFLLNAPWALVSGLFRPCIWEARSLFQIIAGVETLAVLVLFLNLLKRLKNISITPNLLVLLGVITYIMLLAFFLALSTPNIGTLVRYRVGFYPFFVFLLLLANPWITQRNRFLSK